MSSVDKVFRLAAKEGAEAQQEERFGTPYRSEFSEYVGTYRYITSGWMLKPLPRIALALRPHLAPSEVIFTVKEAGGHLCVSDEKLREELPGLFFNASGETLDFREDVPRWRDQ